MSVICLSAPGEDRPNAPVCLPQDHPPFRIRRTGSLLAFVLVASLLGACGSGSDGPTTVATDSTTEAGSVAPAGDGEDGHGDEFHIETLGRLAVQEAGAASVRIIELDSGSVIGTLATRNPVSALYASPDRRYALAVQRNQDLVEFVDGGLWQEDHVDHLHDYREEPTLVPFSLSGVRPTHVQPHGELIAVFNDGLADTNTVASVTVLSDASIGAGRSEAELTLERQMHGAAEPLETNLLVTWRSPENTDTLPERVEHYRYVDGAYTLVRRFDETCPGLHGTATNESHTLFGCTDGVLVVTHGEDAFTASKIANPPGMPDGARIGSLLAHHERPTMIGIARPNLLFEIDPAGATIAAISWPGATRVASAFDAAGQTLLVMDEAGQVHLLDANQGWTLKATLPAATGVPTSGSQPMIESHGHEEENIVYVSDPTGQRIVMIDPSTAAISGQIGLDFAPGQIRWLGIAEHEEHDHE